MLFKCIYSTIQLARVFTFWYPVSCGDLASLVQTAETALDWGQSVHQSCSKQTESKRQSQPQVQIALVGPGDVFAKTPTVQDAAQAAAGLLDQAAVLPSAERPGTREVASYIGDMLDELQHMAHSQNLDVLCLMLAMAQEQAQDDANVQRPTTV